MSQSVHKCPKVFTNVQKCLEMAKSVHKCPKLARGWETKSYPSWDYSDIFLISVNPLPSAFALSMHPWTQSFKLKIENCFVRDFEQSKDRYLFYHQLLLPFMFSFMTEIKMIVMILDLFVGLNWAQYNLPDRSRIIQLKILK